MRMAITLQEPIQYRTVTITLSRRNVLALLHKLDMPGSARTLVKEEENGDRLILQVEDDQEHYAARPEGAPATTALLITDLIIADCTNHQQAQADHQHLAEKNRQAMLRNRADAD